MEPNEDAARTLAEALSEAGVAARVTGGGVHWQ
jgi:hypothetical protein